MELSKLVAQPQLVKIELADEDTIAEFGEAIEFYTWDRQPLDVFLKISNTLGVDHQASVDVLKNLILDSRGEKIVGEGQVLPATIMVKAMAKIVEILGK